MSRPGTTCPTALLAAVTFGWCLVSAAVLVWRYRKLTVTR